jgi:hypothetical protein
MSDDLAVWPDDGFQWSPIRAPASWFADGLWPSTCTFTRGFLDSGGAPDLRLSVDDDRILIRRTLSDGSVMLGRYVVRAREADGRVIAGAVAWRPDFASNAQREGTG